MVDQTKNPKIEKALTGIAGLDEITFGGLPYARPSLISGYAGSGKTVLAMQFVLNGIAKYDEPGVFISLEETEADLRQNMSSFGYNLPEMEKANKLALENIKIRRNTLYHSGRFDLSPLLIRIEEAVNKVNAKRIAIDTFELIFNDIQDENIFRQELVRLIFWLKEHNLTTIFTSEKPLVSQLKSGINEFITDCVITLTHTRNDNIYTRRLHILKYRGSKHGTNEYPFLIDKNGISILPITSVEIHKISSEIISTGVEGLDEKIDKKGFYIGSCTLISGSSGVGKTSVSLSLCIEAMKKNMRCILFTFEESAMQLKRNMKSLGFDLEGFENKGLLKIVSKRATIVGLETHLVSIYKNIQDFKPDVVVFDPVTDLIQIGTATEVRGLLIRVIDFLKSKLITTVFTSLLSHHSKEQELGMSSIVDNWIQLHTEEKEQDKNPHICIVKIRGMKHSRREYNLDFSEKGLKIFDLEGYY